MPGSYELTNPSRQDRATAPGPLEYLVTAVATAGAALDGLSIELMIDRITRNGDRP